MNKIFKSQKRLKKYNLNRLAAWLLAVLMFFSALSTGSMTVQAEATDGNVAQIGSNYYTSLETAINAANVGETITLLANIDLGAEASIAPGKAITIDLNGYSLKALAFNASGAEVVDSSKDKTGVLKVTDFVPAATNSQMPIYNGTDGYVFATMVEQVHRSSVMGADTFELIFKPYFGTETINELLKGGGNAAKVSIGIRLEWTDAESNFQSKDLTYTDQMVQEVYAGTNKAFYIKASGATQFDDLTITPLVKSNLSADLKWSDSEFKATEASTTTYTITFMDGETVISSEPYKKDAAITLPTDPANKMDTTSGTTYAFAGWSPIVSVTATADAIYTAQWMKSFAISNGTATIEAEDVVVIDGHWLTPSSDKSSRQTASLTDEYKGLASIPSTNPAPSMGFEVVPDADATYYVYARVYRYGTNESGSNRINMSLGSNGYSKKTFTASGGVALNTYTWVRLGTVTGKKDEGVSVRFIVDKAGVRFDKFIVTTDANTPTD